MTKRQLQHVKALFLEAFRKTANISLGADAAGINRTTVYRWQEHDEEFALDFRQAEIEATERLEAEAWRRAVEGTRRLKFDKDGDALKDPETDGLYVEQQYSDTLLIVLLKARAPDKYRERIDVSRSNEPAPKVYAGVGLDEL